MSNSAAESASRDAAVAVLRRRWAAIAESAPLGVLEGLLQFVDALPLVPASQPVQGGLGAGGDDAWNVSDLQLPSHLLGAALAFAQALPPEVPYCDAPPEAMAAAAQAATEAFAKSLLAALQPPDAVQEDTLTEELEGRGSSGTEGSETMLRLRVIQAVSGEPVFEPELEVPASMTIRELCLRIASEDTPCARRRFKLLAHGAVLDSSTRLSDLSSDSDVLELQLLCVFAPRLEPAPSDAESDRIAKLVLVGDAAVGKSSMLLRFARRDFTLGPYVGTVGVEFASTTFRLDDRINVKAQVWDTSGSDRFRSIVSSYCRGARGILVVFDVTNRTTFEHVQTWLGDVHTWLGERGDDVVLALAGNKVDLPETSRAVSQAEAEALASSVGISYFESSALVEHPSAIEGLLLEVCAKCKLT